MTSNSICSGYHSRYVYRAFYLLQFTQASLYMDVGAPYKVDIRTQWYLRAGRSVRRGHSQLPIVALGVD